MADSTSLARIEPRQPSLDDMMRFAESAVKSKFYGFTNADQLLPLMMVAQSQGRPFVSVVEEYSVIQGRPALKAEAMLARFQRAGGHIRWTELSDQRVAAIFSHPQCDPVELDWDMDRARQAGLAGRGPWKTYPRAMLKARVISDGVRTAYPACLGGLYCPEEVQDFDPPTASPPSAVRGQLTAPTNAGEHEPSSEPSSSSPISVSFTDDNQSDGLGKGKSAYQAKKDGDWERVKDRLLLEMNGDGIETEGHASKGEAKVWWEGVTTGDPEFMAWPMNWRKTFRDEHFIPHLHALPDDEAPAVVWEDAEQA
jgi:hypothetical protein